MHNWDELILIEYLMVLIGRYRKYIVKRGYKIDNVIIGGTNTAGCVLRSKHIQQYIGQRKVIRRFIYYYVLNISYLSVNQAERNSEGYINNV